MHVTFDGVPLFGHVRVAVLDEDGSSRLFLLPALPGIARRCSSTKVRRAMKHVHTSSSECVNARHVLRDHGYESADSVRALLSMCRFGGQLVLIRSRRFRRRLTTTFVVTLAAFMVFVTRKRC